jgi:dTMP kinase
MDLEWCKACDRGLPAPDCVIYLDMPVEAAAKRGNFGEERYEKIDFQLKVREKFMQLKQENDASGASAVPWHTVDADQTIESIRDQIRDIADRTVEEVKLRPIRRLW